MRLKSAEFLAELMRQQDMSGARLSRLAGEEGRPLARSLISELINGRRTTCSTQVAQRMEQVLRVQPGLLFEPDDSVLVLVDRDELGNLLDAHDMTMARLDRRIGATRGFTWRLRSGRVSKCDAVSARRIEFELNVVAGTLFVEEDVDEQAQARVAS